MSQSRAVTPLQTANNNSTVNNQRESLHFHALFLSVNREHSLVAAVQLFYDKTAFNEQARQFVDELSADAHKQRLELLAVAVDNLHRPHGDGMRRRELSRQAHQLQPGDEKRTERRRWTGDAASRWLIAQSQ